MKSTAEHIEAHLRRRQKDQQRRARAREALTRAILKLRRRYPGVRQEHVAAMCGVDRSMVAKVWTGAATSNKVLVATIQAFTEAGWVPTSEPAWSRKAISALSRTEGRKFAEWNFGALTPGAKE